MEHGAVWSLTQESLAHLQKARLIDSKCHCLVISDDVSGRSSGCDLNWIRCGIGTQGYPDIQPGGCAQERAMDR
ncbi:hypothetical protein ASF71_19795 [Deinococcus sp. Leaf326]|nr:hypothetical protein ASF71_19795 [Deinococcus sp. Leaf326]